VNVQKKRLNITFSRILPSNVDGITKLKIFASLLGAIDTLFTLEAKLQIDVNFGWEKCNFLLFILLN
jgi:hypothetical protein